MFLSRSILKISRKIIKILPKGRTAFINIILRIFGNNYGDEISINGLRFYINKINPVNRGLFFLGRYEEEETKIIKSIVGGGLRFRCRI